MLPSTIKDINTQLQVEKQKRNESAQYVRTSWMLEIAGIPTENEDEKEIVSKVAQLAGITNFNIIKLM